MTKSLNLKFFLEYFNFIRSVTIVMPLFLGTNKARITQISYNLQQFSHSHNYSTEFSRLKKQILTYFCYEIGILTFTTNFQAV